MAELVEPSVALRTSFLAAIAEYQDDRDFEVPWFVHNIEPSALTDEVAFAAYLNRLRDERSVASDRVAQTTLWWVDGPTFLGRLAIRHRLTPNLTRYGGHIGYDVRPTARRQGHATAILAAALPLAATLGITEALLTCAETNTASRRVIESNGGQYVDSSGDRRRYLIPTGGQ